MLSSGRFLLDKLSIFFLTWRGIDWQPNEGLQMFMLPDGLHKATGKTLKGPAVTNTQHTLEEEA